MDSIFCIDFLDFSHLHAIFLHFPLFLAILGVSCTPPCFERWTVSPQFLSCYISRWSICSFEHKKKTFRGFLPWFLANWRPHPHLARYDPWGDAPVVKSPKYLFLDILQIFLPQRNPFVCLQTWIFFKKSSNFFIVSKWRFFTFLGQSLTIF